MDDARTLGQIAVGIVIVSLLVGWGVEPAWCQSVAMIAVTCACAAAIVIAAGETKSGRGSSNRLQVAAHRKSVLPKPPTESHRRATWGARTGTADSIIGPVLLSAAAVLGCIWWSSAEPMIFAASPKTFTADAGISEIASAFDPQTFAGKDRPSILPARTRSAWMPWAITWAAAAASGPLFRRREDRIVLLQSLCVIGWCFAFWGIAQRCRGSSELLFGYEAPRRALPFATVIYKNAAAAWLMMALAANIGWILHRTRSALRETNEKLRAQRRVLSKQTVMAVDAADADGSTSGTLPRELLDPFGMALICGCGLLVTAILFTLCRGMYLLLPLSLFAAGWTLKDYLGRRVLVTVGLSLTVIVLVSLCGLQSTTVRARLQTLFFSQDAASLRQTLEQGRLGHWADAMDTIFDAPILGHGLGTYGYATIEHLEQSTPRWFEHAHCMPLEIAVELGVVGLCVVVLWIGMATRRCERLRRNLTRSSDNVVRCSVVVIAMVPILIQNLFDFTILHPAVAVSAAVLLASMLQRPSGVSSTPAHDSPQPVVIGKDGGRTAAGDTTTITDRIRTLQVRSPAWLGMATLTLVVTFGNLESQRQFVRSTTLASASSILGERPSIPTLDRLEHRLETLASRSPNDSAIQYQLARVAQWRFRYALVSDARHQGVELALDKTHPQTVWTLMDSLPTGVRQSIRCEWFSDDVDAIGTSYIRSVAQAVWRQPRSAPTWLMLADAFAMAGQPTQAWVERAAELDRVGGRSAFRIAVHAHRLRNEKLFRRSGVRVLRFAPEHTGPLLGMIGDWNDAEGLAEDWLSVLPPDRMVGMVRALHRTHGDAELTTAFERRAWATLEAATSEHSLRSRSIAAWRLAAATGRPDLALPILRNAVDQSPEDPIVRAALASALDRDGELDEALRQWRIVLNLQPGHRSATKRLSDWEFERSKSLRDSSATRDVSRTIPNAAP